MQFFTPVRNRRGAEPLVDQVVAAVEKAIRGQVLRPGMSLPSIREFARAHGLSPYTVSAAYGRLVAGNWLLSRPGSGYWVAPSATAPLAEASQAKRIDVRAGPVGRRPSGADEAGGASALGRGAASWTPPRLGAAWLLSDVFADHSIPIKSGCGWLPPEWLDEAGLRQSLRQVSRTPVNQLAGYGHPYGYFPLREYVAQAMARHGMAVSADQVLLTQGAGQGLDIAIRCLMRPGDVIAVESPCYANILPTLRLAGMQVRAIPRDASGLSIGALEQAARDGAIKALFVNTVLQNPTGASLSMHNAFQVLQLAERYDFRIIEDDVSRDLLPDLGPLLAALAPPGRVVYLSGFSKSITPSMRVGYLIGDARFVREFAEAKMALALTTPALMERTVYQVLRQGRYHAHLARIQARLRQAHDEVCALMDEHGLEVQARPGAGLFLWARLPGPWRTGGALQLAEMALADGIWLAPGSYFDPGQADTGWLRFNVAYSRHPALWKFISKTVQVGMPPAPKQRNLLG